MYSLVYESYLRLPSILGSENGLHKSMDPSDVLYFYVSPTLAVLTVLLNSALIHTLIKQYRCNKKSREQKHSIPLIFLANLAISDLLVGLTLVIMKINFYLYYHKAIRWSLSMDLAQGILKFAFLRLSLLTSVFNLTSLTVDRFLAICYPMVYRMKAGNKHAFVVVGITWLLSTIFAAAHYGITYYSGVVLWEYDLVIFPVVVFPAAFVFAICYSLILRAIRKQGRKVRLMLRGHCTSEMKCEGGRSLKVEGESCVRKSIVCSSELEDGKHKENGILTDVSGEGGMDRKSISVIMSSEIGNNSKATDTHISDCKISEVNRSGIHLSTDGGQSSTSSRLRSEDSRSGVPLHIQRREIKIYKFVGTVVGVFVLCWLPIAICGIILIRRPLNVFVVNSVFTFAFANSVIDPILYFFFNYNLISKARWVFKRIFRCTCAREEERLQSSDNLFGASSEGSNSAISKTRSTSSACSADTIL